MKHINYKFELVHRTSTDDLDVMVVRWNWTHSIYGTAETDWATFLIKPDGDEKIVHSNGEVRDFESPEDFDPHGWYMQFSDWLADQ